MAALRVLGGIFVTAAGVLAIAAVVSEHSRSNGEGIAGPAPQVEISWSVTPANKVTPPPQVAMRGSEPQTEIAPVRHARGRRSAAADHHRSRHHHHHGETAISGSAVSEGSAPATPYWKVTPKDELAAVQGRLRSSLSDELYADFALFLYVSKALDGPLAQQMYVFRKARNGALDLLYNWPVSTGRERTELNGAGLELSSLTPAGYFELDSHRFFRDHTSSQWHEPMPFAMFFDRVERGTPSGFAIHAATGAQIPELGKRASAGCIRLAPEAAKTLFTLIRTHYRGLAPRFATDHRTGTTNDRGILLRNANGRAEMTEGYKVLVMIEDYGGRNLVAAID